MEGVTATLLFSASLVCVLVASLILLRLSKSKLKLPPGPRGLPVIGHLHLLGTDLYSSLLDLSKIHGPLMHLRFGSVPVVVASTAFMARQILQVHDATFSFRPRPAAFAQVCGRGQNIAHTNPGPYWKLMRQICQTDLFSTKRLESFRPLITEEVRALLRSVLDSADEVRLRGKLCDAASNIISRMTVGKRVADLATRSDNLANLLSEIVHLLGAFNVSDFFPWLAWMDLQGYVRNAKAIAFKLSQVWQEVIDARREMRQQSHNNTNTASKKERDFLDTLLDTSDERRSDVPLTDSDIMAVLTDMFLGGTDTSSVSIEWALAELIANPIAMKNLQDELVRIVGMSRLVQETDIPSLSYLRAVVKETMRLHPVFPLVPPHKASQECKVSGYDIPAGTLAFVNAWAIGRDPAVWERPLEFRPERFLECNKDVRGQHFDLLPFGSGRRVCSGLVLGLVNVQYMLASLVHSFDWSTKEKLNISEKSGNVMTLANPLVATAMPKLAIHLFE